MLEINWSKCPSETKDMCLRWQQIVAFLCMFTGVNHITAANFDEVLKRFRMWETVDGPLAGDVEGPITHTTLQAFIGASTNCSSMTKRQFEARFAKYAADIALRNAQRAVESARQADTLAQAAPDGD